MDGKEATNIIKNEIFPSLKKDALSETAELKSLRKALGYINKNWEHGVFTAGSTFDHFHNLTNNDLISLSQKLGTQISIKDKLKDVCERIK